MKAVRYHEYGDPAVLTIEETDKPSAKAGEALVRVRATGVHPMDWKLRAGYLQQWMPLEMPHVPGYELAGTIESVGEGVTDLAPGDDVFGSGPATYAEYTAAPVATLAKKPAAMTFEQGASLGLTGVTAWNLVETAEIQPAQRVLIQGGAGGVGALAVQLAKRKGARVIATAATANVDRVRALGADEVIDYTAGRFEEMVKEVDVVLDTVGGDLVERSWAVLKQGGLYVTITGQVDAEAAGTRGIRTKPSQRAERTSPILEQLAALVAGGELKPVVSETFPLTEVSRAHESSQTGHGFGRRVLTLP